jgi:hypothetical protein
VECVVLLTKRVPQTHVKVEFGEGKGKIPTDGIVEKVGKSKSKPRVTYKMIQKYIEEKYRFKVHTANIAKVKRSLGPTTNDAPNKVEERKHPYKLAKPKKVEAIKDALKYFKLI